MVFQEHETTFTVIDILNSLLARTQQSIFISIYLSDWVFHFMKQDIPAIMGTSG